MKQYKYMTAEIIVFKLYTKIKIKSILFIKK